MRSTQLCALLLLFPALAFAGWISKQGEKLPETDYRKAIGDFGSYQILVGNEDELFKSWDSPSVTVEVKTVDSVKVNGFINAFVVFNGCTPDFKGNCNVSMRFRVIQPDGKIYAETPPMEVWENKPAPRGKALELSAQYLKIRIEPKDLLGKYVIYTQVRDNNSGVVLQLQSPFTAK